MFQMKEGKCKKNDLFDGTSSDLTLKELENEFGF
jgi:hypothetical protein